MTITFGQRRPIRFDLGTYPVIIKHDAWVPDQVRYTPKSELGLYIRTCVAQHLPSEVLDELLRRLSRSIVVESELKLVVIRPNKPIENLGSVGRKLVTTAGVNFIVDAFQNLVELELLKFHGIGTGSTAESGGDTALVTELTTEYSPDNTRATGSLTEGAANVYRTVGTNTLDGTPGAALREHGIFSSATVGAGTLLDRTVYAAITLSSGDGLQSTYDLTVTAGG